MTELVNLSEIRLLKTLRSQKPAVRGEFRAGKRHGLWVFFYPTGDKWQQGAYHRGQKHGLWTFWNENGCMVCRGEYRRGRRHGRWLFFCDRGQPLAECVYLQGSVIGLRLTPA